MKTEFIDGREYIRLAASGVSALYELKRAPLALPVKAVMMDLDGTSLDSERFWVMLIENTVKKLLDDDGFTLAREDLPHVTGFTTREHLDYCIKKYDVKVSLDKADEVYHAIASDYMKNIESGKLKTDAFTPREGLKEFISMLKSNGIKVGLATSGLLYKARTEIAALSSYFGKAHEEVYDAIITGGERKTDGRLGTLGEMVAKPHPWIYAELAAALGVDQTEAVVIEDSVSGAISGRLAGFPVLGFSDGTIVSGGAESLLAAKIGTFTDATNILGLK